MSKPAPTDEHAAAPGARSPDGALGDGGSLRDGLRALLDDGQTLAEAELAYQQARVVYGWGRAKGIALLLVGALFFAFFTLVALVVGLLLALTPLLGAWGALGAVTLGLVALTAASFFTAVSRFRRARAKLLGKDQPA